VQYQAPVGWSNYNSLVLQVNRRFANGLLVNAHYTWSKSLDFSQSENFTGTDFSDSGSSKAADLRNFRNDYSPSFFDTPQRLVVSYLYELPFGARKRFRVDNRMLKAFVSGWRTGAVAVFQSGPPIQVTGATDGSFSTAGGGTAPARPNVVASEPVEVPKALQHWYNGKTTVTLPDGRQYTPCAFCFLKFNPDRFQGQVVTTPSGAVVNDVYWFGTAAPSYRDIRGPGMNNWNMTIERTFVIKERLSIDFSARFTNTFNHTQFEPGGNVNSALGTTNVQSTPGIQPGQGLNNNFGTYGMATYDPRQMEFMLRIRF
jgi:hypothetical protein